MTDFEHDLEMILEWEDSDAEVDCEETAKNLTKLGYQKIVWHDAKKELPELNKYVLGYYYDSQNYVGVSWNGVNWSDGHWIYYNIDYWTALPKFSK